MSLTSLAGLAVLVAASSAFDLYRVHWRLRIDSSLGTANFLNPPMRRSARARSD